MNCVNMTSADVRHGLSCAVMKGREFGQVNMVLVMV
jgi:hypothetical protein